jgi:hypothetical protein
VETGNEPFGRGNEAFGGGNEPVETENEWAEGSACSLGLGK